MILWIFLICVKFFNYLLYTEGCLTQYLLMKVQPVHLVNSFLYHSLIIFSSKTAIFYESTFLKIKLIWFHLILFLGKSWLHAHDHIWPAGKPTKVFFQYTTHSFLSLCFFQLCSSRTLLTFRSACRHFDILANIWRHLNEIYLLK